MPQLSCIDCEEPIPAGQPPVVVEWGKPPDIPILGRPIARARCLRCEDKRRGKSGAGAVTGAAAAPLKKEKADVKSPKPSPAAAGGSSSSKFSGDERIYRIVKKNPRKEGTHGWNSFNLIKDGMTVSDYLSKGGRKNDLAWDLDHKFIELRMK